jgi:peptide/nickel transport system permease protein
LFNYIVSRLIQGVLVLLVVSAITFSLLSAAGGDALTLMSSNPATSEKALAEMRQTFGLDKPFYIRYAHWLRNLSRGELGQSFYYQAPVRTVIAPRLLATLELAVVALVLALIISLGLGTAAARWPGGWLDRLSSLIVLGGSSLPRIVTALVALAVVVQTAVFSLGDAGAASDRSAARLLITGFVLSVPVIALFLAQVQDGLKTAMRADFITAARARGLSESRLLLRHAMRSALNPLITIAGYSLGGLISGSVIVETVLGWPGLGQISVTAVRSRDVPLLMGVVLVSAAAVLLGNLIADILLMLNDPQMRSGAELKRGLFRQPTI